MPVPARLSRSLHETLGDDAADELVNWMQQMESNRSELRELNELSFGRLDSRMGEQFSVHRDRWRTDLAAHREEMRADVAAFREEIRADVGAFREEIRADLAAMRGDQATMRGEIAAMRESIARIDGKIEQRFADLIKWSFVFWIGTIAAFSGLIGLAR